MNSSGGRTRDLPACSIMRQSTTLPRAPCLNTALGFTPAERKGNLRTLVFLSFNVCPFAGSSPVCCHVQCCVLFLPSSLSNCMGVPIILGRCPSFSAHESESMPRTYLVCREKQATARGRSIQCTNNSDPITSTSELLLRQNSVTANAHQS
jgi:hypothetical protein